MTAHRLRAEALSAIRAQCAVVARLMWARECGQLDATGEAAMVEARRELERLRAVHRGLVAPVVAMERAEVGL
jgi:hypothetical protein